jgi:hypothetical protein
VGLIEVERQRGREVGHEQNDVGPERQRNKSAASARIKVRIDLNLHRIFLLEINFSYTAMIRSKTEEFVYGEPSLAFVEARRVY